MGVDLSLVPYQRSKWPKKGIVLHREDKRALSTGYWNNLHIVIEALKPAEIPERVVLVYKSDGDPVATLTDPLGGRRLTWLPAGRIKAGFRKALKELPMEHENEPDWFKSLLKGMKKWKPSTPVILYWW